jgi:hypothetical protein
MAIEIKFPVSGFQFLVSGFWKELFIHWGGLPHPPSLASNSQPLFSWFPGDLYNKWQLLKNIQAIFTSLGTDLSI